LLEVGLILKELVIENQISKNDTMNKPGINYQIEYQESKGKNRTAKFDGVWSINLGLGIHDPNSKF
jgi:hypothetical protein